MGIHNDCPRSKWSLAVVQELQKGKDGLVRSATIRTDKGVTSRPISKLYPLEVNTGDETVKDPPDVLDATEDRSQMSHNRDSMSP